MQTKNNAKIIFLVITILVSVLLLPFVRANENISVEITSSLVILDDNTQGNPGMPLPFSRTYLEEGEQMFFGVLVNSSGGINNIGEVYVTVNNHLLANCWPDEGLGWPEGEVLCDVDNYFCSAHFIESPTSIYYMCQLTVETPSSMYGAGLVEVEAQSIDGEFSTPVYVGEWFFNPTISIWPSQSPVSISGVYRGRTIYSQPIKILADVENTDAELMTFISGGNYDFGNIKLEDISYYAYNEEGYSTMNDPRADENGFVNINYGIGFNNPNYFYGSHEIIQIPGLNFTHWNYMLGWLIGPGVYGENNIGEDEEITIILRYKTPSDFPLNFTSQTANLYIWGSSGEGWGIDVGNNLDINFIPASIACFSNLDCDDGNRTTVDSCINPSTPNAQCKYESVNSPSGKLKKIFKKN